MAALATYILCSTAAPLASSLMSSKICSFMATDVDHSSRTYQQKRLATFTITHTALPRTATSHQRVPETRRRLFCGRRPTCFASLPVITDNACASRRACAVEGV